MSLVFSNIKNLPQTHVLIIGVGGYPYLKNGLTSVAQTFDAGQLLGQLTSPPVSAEAFYKTVTYLENSQSWVKSLGSVEVLVSPSPSGKNVFSDANVDSATMENISKAYYKWKQRCDTHADNVAIFFFCGHGLDKGEHYLLAEDFGKNPYNPWTECFAFDMTRRAFHSCKAQTQLFFIDACRQVTSDMIDQDISALPIDFPSFKKATECQYNLTQKAAAANELAFSQPNEPSFYTKALIGALTGKVATKVNGTWKIFLAGLSANMTALMRMEAEDEGYPQRCFSTITDTTELLWLPQPPDVQLNLTCDPEAALGYADLACIDPVTNTVNKRVPEPNPWTIKIKAGVYKIEAIFQAKQYPDQMSFIPVLPPSTNEKIVCI